MAIHVVMILNKTEKEGLVIELWNKGLNVKQISKQAMFPLPILPK